MAIPRTRILSYIEFCNGRKKAIKPYVLHLLKKKTGLSRREISEVSGIEIGSLTHPLKELSDNGELIISGVKRCQSTKRLVQLYAIAK